jgi:hypothetical protein
MGDLAGRVLWRALCSSLLLSLWIRFVELRGGEIDRVQIGSPGNAADT